MAQSKRIRQIKSKVGLSTLPIMSWLFPVLAVIIIVVTLFAVLKPQVSGILSDRDEIEVKGKELEKLVAKSSFLESQSEANLRDQIVAVNQVLPSDKPVFNFIQGLVRLAVKNEGVAMGDYTLEPGSLATESATLDDGGIEKAGELSEMETEFDITGSYENVLEYIANLHKLAPIVAIKQMKFVGDIDPAGDHEQAEVTATLVVGVLYSIPLESYGDIADPLPKYSGDVNLTMSRLQEFDDFAEADEVLVDIILLDNQRQNPFAF